MDKEIVEYELPIKFRRLGDSNRHEAQCPLCSTWYQGYLVPDVPGGLIGCRHCIGQRRLERTSAAIQTGLKIVIDRTTRRIDMELAKLLGFL